MRVSSWSGRKKTFASAAAAAVTALIILALSGTPCLAAVSWGAGGKPVCSQGSAQDNAQIAPDGSGGAVIVWEDKRSGTLDIYAQRVNSSGTRLWGNDGKPVCVSAKDQVKPVVAGDGAGGAVIAWEDLRTGTRNIYAQKLNSSGSPVWSANGKLAETFSKEMKNPQVISDGAGGAFIAWSGANSTGNYYAYTQRMTSATGAYQWDPTNGVIMGPATAYSEPTIVSDGYTGAYVSWDEGSNIRANHVSSTGTGKWSWSDGIIAAPSARYFSEYPLQMVADGNGAAIVTWIDEGAPGNSTRDVYAQKFFNFYYNGNSYGLYLWGDGGKRITATNEVQGSPSLAPDGTGGAILSYWEAHDFGYFYVRAQRLNSSGDRQWGDTGKLLSTKTVNGWLWPNPKLAADGAGGAFVVWCTIYGYPTPPTQQDITSQRVNSAGTLLWGVNGTDLTNYAKNEKNPQITYAGANKAITAWTDERNASADIYGQRLY